MRTAASELSAPRETERALRELNERGFVHLPGAGLQMFRELAAALGDIVQTTEIVVRPESRALVTSPRALDLHTDHHAVDYIVWLCHRPASAGGDSVLADARRAWNRLSPEHRDALQRILLKEHRVFEDDLESHPLVELVCGGPRFYYSFWLLEDLHEPAQRDALAAFRAALDEVPRWKRRLEPGCVLAIDNRRTLHGRTAIRGDHTLRHLQRLWIRAPHGSHQPNGGAR